MVERSHRHTNHAHDTEGEAPRLSAVKVSKRAMSQLAELVGRAPDSVSMLTANDNGWRLHVEIVELERVPQTTSVLATYDVHADRAGNVQSYERLRRYTRSQAGEL